MADCVNGKRKINYVFDEPAICDNSTIVLPQSYEEKCLVCEEGHFMNQTTNQCSQCAKGWYKIQLLRYSNEEIFSTLQGQCKQCPFGSYPIRTLNISRFQNFPSSFENYCSSIKSENCMGNSGFKEKLFKVISGNNLPYILELHLVVDFEVEEEQGEISYKFSLNNPHKGESFYVKINGVLQGSLFFIARILYYKWYL
jgi:hypothetical protein